MADFYTETFTAATGTLLTAHTADSGGSYVSVIGSPAPQIFSTLGGVVGGPGGAITLYRNTVIAPVADILMTAGFYYDSLGFGNVGIAGRLNAAGTAGYLAVYSSASKKWEIYRLGSGQSTTLLASSAVINYAQTNTPQITGFKITGTGSTVTIGLEVNSAIVIADFTDTHAERATAAGYSGIWSNRSANIADSGMFVGSIGAGPYGATNVTTITSPANGEIEPLSTGVTGTATFSLAGTYTGTAPDQWRVVLDGTNTPESGLDWTAFSTAPSAGSFAQSIPSVPKRNGWYNVQVRNSASPTEITSSGMVGAGVLVAVDGQSNAWLWFSSDARGGDGALTANTLLRVTGKQAAGSWIIPGATMNAAIACGNALAAALACPIGLIDGSWDASGLTIPGANGASGPNGQWVPTSTNAYGSSLNAINTAGGKIIANIWIQGEGDAGAGVTQAAYYTALGTMIAQRRADLSASNLPYIMVMLARDTTGMSSTNRENIKKAQVQKCGDANILRVDRMDLPLSDGVHHSPPGYTTLGSRCAQAVLAGNGLVAQYRGPSYSTVTRVDPTHFDVNLVHHSGSDFTPASAITDFRVTDPGASGAVIAVSSAVRQNATAIRLATASAPVALPEVAYLYGSAPNITGVVKDDSALALPLEYNPGVTATTASTSVTITVAHPSEVVAVSMSSPGISATVGITVQQLAEIVSMSVSSPGMGATLDLSVQQLSEIVSCEISAPAPAGTEPITLAEAKAHLRVVFNDEDVYISSLITAAREMAEGRTQRAIVLRTEVLALDCFETPIRLPYPPLRVVSGIDYDDQDGAQQTLDSTTYRVNAYVTPARITRAVGASWPATATQEAAVRVRYTCGYPSASAVPTSLRQWMLLAIGALYENRESVTAGVQTYALPDDFMALLLQPHVVYM